MSEFNAENVTAYKSGDGSDDPEDTMEQENKTEEKLFEGVEIVVPGLDEILTICQQDSKNKVKVDYNLYVKFWSLQDFFRNPMQCYNKLAWKTFSVVSLLFE
jgi:THO complex subunit 1